MARSPGHQKWPEHAVTEKKVDGTLRVEVGDEVVAESEDVIRVDEDEHPPRYYFSRSDVDMALLEPSGKETDCPFKGHARYFDVRVDGRTVSNAAWSYEDPYEEHRDLRNRVAFHEAEIPEIQIAPAR